MIYIIQSIAFSFINKTNEYEFSPANMHKTKRHIKSLNLISPLFGLVENFVESNYATHEIQLSALIIIKLCLYGSYYPGS